MSDIVQALTATEGKATAAARAVWTKAVIASARGESLAGPAVAELSTAMATLGRTPGQFSEESTRLRAYLALKARCDALMSPEESEREYRARIADRDAKRAEFEALTKAMRVEIDELEQVIQQHGHADARLRQELAAAEPAVRELLFLMGKTAAK